MDNVIPTTDLFTLNSDTQSVSVSKRKTKITAYSKSSREVSVVSSSNSYCIKCYTYLWHELYCMVIAGFSSHLSYGYNLDFIKQCRQYPYYSCCSVGKILTRIVKSSQENSHVFVSWFLWHNLETDVHWIPIPFWMCRLRRAVPVLESLTRLVKSRQENRTFFFSWFS